MALSEVGFDFGNRHFESAVLLLEVDLVFFDVLHVALKVLEQFEQA